MGHEFFADGSNKEPIYLNLMLLGVEGCGKQQPVDTKVLTPRGWRRIGDLRVGDSDLGSDGKPTKVLGVYPQGVKPSYRVTFSDWSSVEAGPEHLWVVRTQKTPRRVLTTAQLLSRRAFVEIPMMEPAVFSVSRPAKLPLPPYLLGQLIGNGGCTHGTQLTTGVRDWPAVRAQLEIKPSSERQYDNTVHATFIGIRQGVRATGLEGKSSKEKRIPRAYFTASVVDRKSLLFGLMDSDGSISKVGCKIGFHTVNKGLAEDVQELVECLGGIASLMTVDRRHHGKPVEYKVGIRLPFCPFTVPFKKERWTPSYRARPLRSLRSVEYVRDVESVCIRVAAKDCLYATEHAILTHNTTFAGTFPKPYFIVFSAEKGKESVVGRHAGYVCDSWADCRAALEKVEGPIRKGQWLDPKTKEPFKTLVIDGGSYLGQVLETWAKTQPDAAKNDKILYKYIKWAMLEFMGRFQSLPGIHTIFTIHTRTFHHPYSTISSMEPNFAGYYGEELPRMVFGRIWMEWVTIDSTPANPNGRKVLRSYLRPHGAMNANIKRDGREEDTGLVLPDHIDNLAFPILADMMGVCGVNVHHAPGTYTESIRHWLLQLQAPMIGGGQPA